MAIVLRSVKGSPLTISEVDGNFTTLDTGKLDKTGGTSLYLGTGANSTRFPNALTVISNTASGIQQNEPHNAGLISEGTGSSLTTTISGTSGATSITVGSATGILIGQLITGTGIAPNATVTNIVSTTITVSFANTGTVSGTGTFSNIGVGVYSKGYTAGAARSGGIVGEGHVSASTDTGSAIGVRGYSNDTHAGGLNIGLYGDAAGGSSSYSLYLNRGDIYSAVAQTWTLSGNLTFSGAYTVTIPTLSLSNALSITSGGTGSTSTNYCSLTTNVSGTLPVANGGTGSTSTNYCSLTTNVSGTLPVANGGTGLTTITANSVLLGNGTGTPQLVAPGTSGNILTSNGTTWTSAALSLVPAWQIKTTTYTASAKDYILANTSGGAFTITLPPSPAINDFVTIADYAGTFGTNNLTVNSNSLNLMGSVQTLVMNVSSRNVTLVYADATKGWVITL